MRAKDKEETERRWRRHLAAAQRSGQTLWRYAAERGLSSGALYAARRRLAAQVGGAVAAAGESPSPFAAVRVVAVPRALAPSVAGGACLRARLGNGTSVELECAVGAEGLLVAAIAALAGRGACSASTPA